MFLWRVSGMKRVKAHQQKQYEQHKLGSVNDAPTATNTRGESVVLPRDCSNDKHITINGNPQKNAPRTSVRDDRHMFETNNRRLSSRRLAKPENDANAILYLDLCNIRKKLNFKDTKPPESRHVKRARLATIPCHAHLTIWDNSHGQTNPEPRLTVSTRCELVKDSYDDTSQGQGRILHLHLDEPFRIPREQLLVPVKGEETLQLARKYFMEIKLVPTIDGNKAWPPFQTLGKSDGHQQARIDDLTKRDLQDSLIARQEGLIADTDKALSVFFFSGGLLWRTKYALQMCARWETLSTRIPTPISIQKPKVRYLYNSQQILDGVKGEFGEHTVEGYVCHNCNMKACQTLEDLLFHLKIIHHLFHYSIEEAKESDGTLTGVTIRIEECAKPQAPTIEEKQHNELTGLLVPYKPSDIKSHTSGDDTSLGGKEAPKLNKKLTSGKRRQKALNEDSRATLRKQHDGFLPASLVPVFRPHEQKRKKYPHQRLQTGNPLQSVSYSSISHRRLLPDTGDDSVSDSDDEADDSYLVGKWAQDLDLFARRQQWSDAKRRLYKKWGYHVFFREGNPHSRFISDCLIRFIRLEKQWVLRRSAQWRESQDRDELEANSLEALDQLLSELKERRVINQAVCDDVALMLDSEM